MKNNIEDIVLEEFGNYFNIDKSKISLSDDISSFDVDSLDAMQIGTNLEQKFNIDFTFSSVREMKTLEDICKYIEGEL